MTVAVVNTILDVRREPINPEKPLIEDPLQETQLLPGETIIIHERKGDWAYIEAPEQPCFKKDWAGYKGWVLLQGLDEANGVCSHIVAQHGIKLGDAAHSVGSKIRVVGEKNENYVTEIGEVSKKHCSLIAPKVDNPGQFIVDAALTFLGMPYQWGGRSSYLPNDFLISSVDCSGLVNLCFLMLGKMVPRDAHDQWLKAKPLEPNELKPGDLFFTAKASRPERMTHVMIFKDQNTLIEAASAAGKVQEISIFDKFGAQLDQLKNGICLHDKVIFSGTLH